MHYKLTDLYPAFVNDDTDGAIKHLCSITAADARAVIENCPANGELLAVAVHHGFTDLYPSFFNDGVDGIVKYLCKIDADDARALVTACPEHPQLIRVAAHHGFTDLASALVDRNGDAVVKYLCGIDADEAQSVLEECLDQGDLIRVAVHHRLDYITDAFIAKDVKSAMNNLCRCKPARALQIIMRNYADCRLIRVAVHHGFTDIVRRFIIRDSGTRITSPAWTSTSPHRLSTDCAENSWLWLMIGDGDLDGKVWAAVEAGGLVMDGRNAAKLVSGVYKSGRKVCKDVLTAMVKKYQTILHNYNAESYSLDAVKCLVEAGADVNMRDYRGCTPLHCAKAAGLTPLGSASRWHSNHDVADYLRSIGAPK
jgi:hypothetical protein